MRSFSISAACLLIFGLWSSVNSQRSFTNPIIEVESGDPQAVFLDGFYYLLFTSWESGFRLHKSPTLTNFRNAESQLVAPLPPHLASVWAPEILLIRGELYIYFCAEPTGNSNGRRNFVIKADDPRNPFGSWSEPLMLAPDFEYISIDGTVMQHDGRLYFVWSTLHETAWGLGDLHLWIAEMQDPLTVIGEKKLLRYPTRAWECSGGCVNEGPHFLYSQNASFLVFSASSTWDPNYCLGMMSITADKDPMDVDSWDFGEDHCVFASNDEESVYTTGHAAFVQSNDGAETWMTYHQTAHPTGDVRIASIEKINWDQNGRPVFPRAHGHENPMAYPSGDLSGIN